MGSNPLSVAIIWIIVDYTLTDPNGTEEKYTYSNQSYPYRINSYLLDYADTGSTV